MGGCKQDPDFLLRNDRGLRRIGALVIVPYGTPPLRWGARVVLGERREAVPGAVGEPGSARATPARERRRRAEECGCALLHALPRCRAGEVSGRAAG